MTFAEAREKMNKRSFDNLPETGLYLCLMKLCIFFQTAYLFLFPNGMLQHIGNIGGDGSIIWDCIGLALVLFGSCLEANVMVIPVFWLLNLFYEHAALVYVDSSGHWAWRWFKFLLKLIVFVVMVCLVIAVLLWLFLFNCTMVEDVINTLLGVHPEDYYPYYKPMDPATACFYVSCAMFVTSVEFVGFFGIVIVGIGGGIVTLVRKIINHFS